MVEAYYAIVLLILALTLPLGSRKLVYSASPEVRGYSPLNGMSGSAHKAAIVGAVLISIGLIVICIFKPETLPDRAMYEQYYDMGGGDKMNRELEPTFTILVRMAPSFMVLLGLYAVLSVSGHIVAIFSNSPNIWLSLLIYLSYTFILHDMIQMRAGVAIGLLLIAVRFIRERKWIVYFLFVALAYTFHYSALIFVFFYFIPTKHLNKWIWSAILILCTIAGLLNTQLGYVAKFLPVGVVQTYLENYMGSKTYIASEIGPARLFKIFCAIIMLFNQKSILRSYPYTIPVLIFYMCSQMSYLLLSDIPVLQGRFGEMFAAFDIFALAMFPLISKKHYYLWWIVPIALVVYQHIEANRLLTYVVN
ncbi:MAG: EpsG family protein [Muribaculaceae bacterium]|nr:EpsG family protein [Muribaculaceae bacterium]